MRERKTVMFVPFVGSDVAEKAATLFRANVAKLGMPWSAEYTGDLDSAGFIVAFAAMPGPEHLEVWPQDPGKLEAEVHDLVARLFTGAKRVEKKPAPPEPVKTVDKKPAKVHTVKMSRETKGRAGKGVTLLSEFPIMMPIEELQKLTTTLKTRCGTGGTLKDRTIEIQGDQRERLTIELEKLGYKVKRAGG
jgi:translation initiation factor 1